MKSWLRLANSLAVPWCSLHSCYKLLDNLHRPMLSVDWWHETRTVAKQKCSLTCHSCLMWHFLGCSNQDVPRAPFHQSIVHSGPVLASHCPTWRGFSLWKEPSLEDGMKEQDGHTANFACQGTAFDESRRLETRYLTAVVEFVSDNNRDSTHPRTWVT